MYSSIPYKKYYQKNAHSVVERRDVEEAMRLMAEATLKAATDPETGELSVSVSFRGGVCVKLYVGGSHGRGGPGRSQNNTTDAHTDDSKLYFSIPGRLDMGNLDGTSRDREAREQLAAAVRSRLLLLCIYLCMCVMGCIGHHPSSARPSTPLSLRTTHDRPPKPNKTTQTTR